MNALGTIADGALLELNLQRLIGSHACVVANSGGGKSGLLRRLLEVTQGEVQHIVLDIEDEFYTLRETHEYVIAGGDGGDTPATLDNAEGLARAALQFGFSLIVQLNDLGSDAPAFVDRFLKGLFSAPREHWHPVLVVIDEAQRFAPNSGSTDASEAVRDLVERGRKRGFTAILASLAITSIDPRVRGLCNNWLLGRVGQALDRDTMANQLGFTAKQGRERLIGMPSRQFWAFGPALADEPTLFTSAPAETTIVHSGDPKVATPPAPEAMREILAGLAAATPAEPSPAASDANSPSQAQLDEIADLRAKLVQAEQFATEAYRRGKVAGIATGLARAGQAITALRVPQIADEVEPEGTGVADSPPVHSRSKEPLRPGSASARPRATLQSGSDAHDRPLLVTPSGSTPSPAAQAIVELLDRVNPARLTWTQAATMTGRKASGGNFNAARKWIRESGRIVEDGEFIRSAAPDPTGLSREEAILLWQSVLTNPAPRMIETLRAGSATPDVLAGMLGVQPRGGNWNNGLAQLRRNGVADLVDGRWGLADPLPGESA